MADVVERKPGLLPPFVHVHPADDVRTAIESLREYEVSQLPVLSTEPPVMAAEVVGSIVERDLLDALVTGRARPEDAVSGLMSPPLPMVGSGEPISAAVAALGHGRRRAGAGRRQARRNDHPPGRADVPVRPRLGHRATPLAATRRRYTGPPAAQI